MTMNDNDKAPATEPAEQEQGMTVPQVVPPPVEEGNNRG
jgi:hypothetical protein